MSVAERFANSDTYPNFSSSQMVAMLSLPSAEETEKFIAEKAAVKSGEISINEGYKQSKRAEKENDF